MPSEAEMQDRFSSYHPLVNFLYFTLVIGFSMTLSHPLAQGISLVCALIYAVQKEGTKAVLFGLKWICKLKVQDTTISNLKDSNSQ